MSYQRDYYLRNRERIRARKKAAWLARSPESKAYDRALARYRYLLDLCESGVGNDDHLAELLELSERLGRA